MRLEAAYRQRDGAVYVVQGRGINSDQEIAFDLLGADPGRPTATDCSTFIFERLRRTTVTMRLLPSCLRPDYRLDPNGRLYCLRQLFENPSTSPALRW